MKKILVITFLVMCGVALMSGCSDSIASTQGSVENETVADSTVNYNNEVQNDGFDGDEF